MKQAKRWILADTDQGRADGVARELNLAAVVANMLVRRGITEPEMAMRFLHPKRADLYDPFLMKDMDKAVERIRKAIARQEQVMVYGDYDADGAASTSLLYLALQTAGAKVEYYIPDRFAEGYGLNGPALEQASKRGFALVITVDNGITAVEEVELANTLGMDLIITDHHTPPAVLPNAYAILNPKQSGCAYPDKMLAGVGVAYKLAHALLGELPEALLDLVAIGTVADLAPLVDENRLLTVFGLERINQNPRPGVRALIEVSGLGGKPITAGHIGFSFGPRINASGRLDSATYAVELLTTDDPLKADELAQFLNERNQERQDISAQIFDEAVQEIESHPKWLEERVLVVAKEGWNAGVIGIVASRLVEKYYRPTLMISIAEGIGKGSARSIDGFHLFQALDQCRDLFEHFGGHKMAAGFSLEATRIEQLRERLNRTAAEVLTDEDLIPKMELDAELNLSELSLELITEVGRLAPFGFGNPSPRFQLNGVTLETCRRVGQTGDHLQLVVSQGPAKLGGIAFKRGGEAELVSEWQRLDLVGEIGINEWKGKTSLQIQVDDWRPNRIQIFDRRRVEDKKRWVEEQAGNKPLTVVCFHEESVAEAKQALERYPWQESYAHKLYVAATGGTLQPTEESQTLCGDVVFYDLPVSLEQYQVVVSKLAGEFRLYLLHGITDKQWAERKKRMLLPDRKIFAGIYKILEEFHSCTAAEIRNKLQPAYRETADVVLSVFVELGFAVREGNTYHVSKDRRKRALETSSLYQKQQGRVEAYSRVIETLIDASSEQTVAQLTEYLTTMEGVNLS